MLKHILLLATVVACHPGGGEAQHPDPSAQQVAAKRWIYASFFNRVKRQLAYAWDPAAVWRRVDPTGTRYGSKTLVTEVRVSLSPQGELAKSLNVITAFVDPCHRAFHGHAAGTRVVTAA